MSEKVTHQDMPQALNIPFRVKSAGVSMVTILIIGCYYIANLLSLLPSGEAVPDGALKLMITAAVLIIVVEIVLQIVLFIGAGQIEKRTKRDDDIASQASRNAYLVLTMGVFATIGSLFAGHTPFEMSSILLLAFLLAEVVKFGSQMVYYRSAV
ncbi:MAG: hypothetical protein GC179_25570 [Anaerolineaceae bacterium]|nr:hypothetical protein [Anaerolineaceae bacterium]